MKVKIRVVLEDAIERGIRAGYRRAYKHTENPCEDSIHVALEDAIWLEVDNIFCFEDEYNMMYTFINKILPGCSLIIGWNYLPFDWKYIYNRCKKLGIDITAASPSRKVQGNDNILMQVGIIDYLDIYRRWDRTVAYK